MRACALLIDLRVTASSPGPAGLPSGGLWAAGRLRWSRSDWSFEPASAAAITRTVRSKAFRSMQKTRRLPAGFDFESGSAC